MIADLKEVVAIPDRSRIDRYPPDVRTRAGGSGCRDPRSIAHRSLPTRRSARPGCTRCVAIPDRSRIDRYERAVPVGMAPLPSRDPRSIAHRSLPSSVGCRSVSSDLSRSQIDRASIATSLGSSSSRLLIPVAIPDRSRIDRYCRSASAARRWPMCRDPRSIAHRSLRPVDLGRTRSAPNVAIPDRSRIDRYSTAPPHRGQTGGSRRDPRSIAHRSLRGGRRPPSGGCSRRDPRSIAHRSLHSTPARS